MDIENKNQTGTANQVTLVKSGFWYTVSGFLTKAMVFITTPIFTRILTKEQYGDFSIFASWQSIFVIICGLEVYATLNVARFDYTKKEEYNAYISSCLLLSSSVTMFVFLLYLLFPDLFHRFFLLDRKYILMMFGYLFAFPAFEMFQTKQRLAYRYKLNAAIAFFLAISSSIFAVVLASVFSNDRLMGRIVGQYSLYIVAGIFFYACFLNNSTTIKLSYIKYAFKIAVPLVFSFLASSILLLSDNLVVKHLGTGAQVSYLSITHSIANILILLVQILNGAWAPWFYDKLKMEDRTAINKTFKGYAALVVLGTMGVLLLAPEIVMILGGQQYMEAVNIIPIVVTNGVFTLLTSQFANLETYYKKPQYAAMATSVVAVTHVALIIVAIKLFDYTAVCYVTAFCQILLIGIHYRIARSMGAREIISVSTLVTVIGLTLACVPVALVLYKNNIIRFGLIAAIIITVIVAGVIKRKEICKLASAFLKKNQK